MHGWHNDFFSYVLFFNLEQPWSHSLYVQRHSANYLQRRNTHRALLSQFRISHRYFTRVTSKEALYSTSASSAHAHAPAELSIRLKALRYHGGMRVAFWCTHGSFSFSRHHSRKDQIDLSVSSLILVIFMDETCWFTYQLISLGIVQERIW